jgi:GNAT superfamily N-acetyltransferase
MVEIVVYDGSQYRPAIRELFWEYLQWANERINQEYSVSFDVAAILEQDLLDLGKFLHPAGRLLLGLVDGEPQGIACLKHLEENCGEVKRMFVRPAARKLGLGSALLDRLLVEAAQMGYQRVRLDSARFMEGAHRLYQKFGFQEIEPYPGSEIPLDFQKNWVFMQKDLPRG